MPWWAFILFSWPAIVLAGAAYAVAFLTTRTWAGFVGAVIIAPFCMFLSGYPLLHWVALVAFAANFVAAWLLRRGRPDVAFAALVPVMMMIATLTVFAFRDIRLVRG
jgi:hypothetical protein